MKTKIIAASAILAAIIVTVLLFKACTHQAIKKEDKAIQAIAAIKNDTTKHYTDKAGNEHAEKQQAVGTQGQISAVYNPEIEFLKKQLDIANKQIQAFTGFTVVQHDTVPVLVGSWQKRGNDSVFVTKDSTIYINLRDSLSIVQYLKKTGWFKHEPFIDVVSYSRGSTVTDIKGFRVTQAPAGLLSIGPAGAIVYHDGQFVPAAGVGIVLRVWKIPVSISALKTF